MVIDLERIRRATEVPFEDLDIGLLQSGWWNPDWAGPDLPHALKDFLRPEIRVLECGSGGTTFMLAMAARDMGVIGLSLEENPRYARLLRSTLGYHDLEWSVIDAPVTRQGEDLWYAHDPRHYDLVVCDGPQEVAGEQVRHGLWAKLKAPTTILFDDADRDSDTLARWKAMGAKVDRFGPIAIVMVE